MLDDTAQFPTCVIHLDHHGLVLDWGPDASRIFGWASPDAQGRPLASLVFDPHQAAAFDDGLREFRVHGSSAALHQIVDRQAMARDGHAVHIECCTFPMGDRGNGGFAFSARDVSKREHAHGLLQRSEAHHRAVVEHLGEGMVVIQDERIVFANPQADEILRAPHAALMGMRAIDLLHPEDRISVAERLARRHRCARRTLRRSARASCP